MECSVGPAQSDSLACCADSFPTQQLRLLSTGSLAGTTLVALIGLVPAAENLERLLRFLRLGRRTEPEALKFGFTLVMIDEFWAIS